MKDIIESIILTVNHLDSVCSLDDQDPRVALARIEDLLKQGFSLEEVLEDLTW